MADEMKALQSEVEYYSEILGRLMEVSGLSDVDEMVTRYIAIEDQNFALFTFVKDQELLLEELQSEIENLQAEIEKLRSLNSTITAERKVILKELEEKLKRVSQTRRTDSAENKRAYKILHEAKKMVWSLCRKISRNEIGFPGVPSNPIVNDNNVAQFLGIIENKANEFLQIKLLIAIEKYDDKAIKFLHSTWIGQLSNSTKLPSSPLPGLPENLEPMPDSLGDSQPPGTNQNGDDTC